MVVLIIRRCVNTMEVKMKTARLVKEDGREVDASVGCKAVGKPAKFVHLGPVISRSLFYTKWCHSV